jgi:hypothetical protein
MDGKLGPEITAAIINFQRKLLNAPTGILSGVRLRASDQCKPRGTRNRESEGSQGWAASGVGTRIEFDAAAANPSVR